MIAMLKHDNALARRADIAPIAKRHFERHLDRCRTAVAIEHMIETVCGHIDQRPRQILGRLVGMIGKDHLIEPVHLALDGSGDTAIAMAMCHHPPGRNGINNARPIAGIEIGALAPGDHRKFRLQCMLGKGMPDG